MNKEPLGRLQRITDLRRIWLSESSDFTPWLSQSENLKILGETLGIKLALDTQEKEVGPFFADIVCKDEANSTWVLIENQLERTDHTHLGQLLTYAAGLDAVTIIWIAQRFTEEHRAALDWLNEKTEEGINCFGLEIELWQIGDSPIAPKFNIVSKPNQWTNTARSSPGEPTGIKRVQLSFWTGFKQYVQANSTISCSSPYPGTNMSHFVFGRPSTLLMSIASTYNSVTNNYSSSPELRVELVLDGPRSKNDFEALANQKAEIENMIGAPLTWYNPETARVCRISTRKDADFRIPELWPEQHRWLLQMLERFQGVFKPLLSDIDAANASGEQTLS